MRVARPVVVALALVTLAAAWLVARRYGLDPRAQDRLSEVRRRLAQARRRRLGLATALAALAVAGSLVGSIRGRRATRRLAGQLEARRSAWQQSATECRSEF